MKKIESDLLRTSELERETGVSGSTIRYWVRSGVLKPDYVSKGGYYFFRRDAVDKVKMIIEMQKMGLSLEEIKELSKLGELSSEDLGYFSKNLYDVFLAVSEGKTEELVEEMFKPVFGKLGVVGERIKGFFVRRFSLELENLIRGLVQVFEGIEKREEREVRKKRGR